MATNNNVNTGLPSNITYGSGGYTQQVNASGVSINAKDIDNDGLFDQASISTRVNGVAVTDNYDLTDVDQFNAFAAVVSGAGVGVGADAAGNEVLVSLRAEQQALLSSVAGEARLIMVGGPSVSDAKLQSQWASFVSTGGFSEVDINALVQAVLRESYMESMQDLRFYAEKVSFYNNLKKEIRGELDTLREGLTTAASAGASKPEDPLGTTLLSNNFDGSLGIDPDTGKPVSVGSSSQSITTTGELEDQIKKLEERLNSVGDDAQLANVDLQNMLQKQQQTLQMMSNISKMLHDTAMSIIRKIGG